MAISQETIQQVGQAADIVAVVGEYTRLTRRGGNDWWGCCPFHNEKTASFHVDGDKRLYYCFGCHAGGDVIKFVMETEKISYSDAILALAKKTGVTVQYTGDSREWTARAEEEKKKEAYIDLYERTSIMFNYLLTLPGYGKKAYTYIKNRGITDETIASFRLGYAPKDRRWLKDFLRKKKFSDEFLASSGLFSKKYPDVSFFSDRLMFPIMDKRGKCVAFGGRLLPSEGEGMSGAQERSEGPKYLNSGDMAQYKKGSTLYAFNAAKKAIREGRRVIFCEGYMDCIAYHQCGINFAVAPLGTALTEEQLKSVSGFVDTVILSFDSDEAGVKATKRAILMCKKMLLDCRVVMLAGGKDPAEIMLKLGYDVLTKYVDEAILDSDFLLYRLGQEYAIGTPDGKTRACLSFFEYVDTLPSTVQQDACLEKLSAYLSLRLDAVRRDYNKREDAKRRLVRHQETDGEVTQLQPIRLGSQLRAVLAAAANMNYAAIMTDALEEGDFSDDAARGVFLALKRCVVEHRPQGLSQMLSILAEEEEKGAFPKGMGQAVLDAVSSGEYTAADGEKMVKDSVESIKRGALAKVKASLTEAIAKQQGGYVAQILENKARIDTSAVLGRGEKETSDGVFFSGAIRSTGYSPDSEEGAL